MTIQWQKVTGSSHGKYHAWRNGVIQCRESIGPPNQGKPRPKAPKNLARICRDCAKLVLHLSLTGCPCDGMGKCPQ